MLPDKSVDLFDVLATHAATRAEQCAVDDGHMEVSFGELMARVDGAASQLADLLPDDDAQHVVALAIPPSVLASIYALGILRSGNIWLQINLDSAEDVLADILQHSRCEAVIGFADQGDSVKHLSKAAFLGVRRHKLPSKSTGLHRPLLKPEMAADLYYTSGSTGRPKGVWKSHRSTLSSGRARVQTGDLGPQDRAAIFGDWGYSYVRNTFYASLLSGAQLIIPHGRYKKMEAIDQWLVDEAVTVTAMIPSAARAIAMAATVKPKALRQIVLGGEATTRQDIEAIRAFVPEFCQIHNQFGAAEAGYIGFTDYTHLQDDGELKRFRLLDRHVIDILDADENGIGVMKVNGPNVSNGYWCDEAMTRSRFFIDDVDPDARTFLTDDLVREVGDGYFERAGRADDRVKVRGYNVYLKDVENVLLDIPEIVEACVLVDSRRDSKSLLGFVATDSQQLSSASIRSRIRDALPPQHIPRKIVVLNALPRSERGKIDRQALASLSSVEKRPVNLPVSDLEFTLVEIWKRVLDLDDVDVLDEFVALGGDSLLAVQLISEVRKTTGVDNPTALLQEGNTIRSMAEAISSRDTSEQTLVTLRSALRKSDDDCPLFLVPGSGGEPYNLTILSSLLPEGRPIYAFRRTHAELISVDRLASQYVEVLRRREPVGPYVIAGFSFGGTVALQMGKLLTNAGESVSLVMLDVSLKPSQFFGRMLRRLILKKPAGDFVASGSAHFHWFWRFKSGVRRIYHWHLKGVWRHIQYRLTAKQMTGQIRSNLNQSLSSLGALTHSVSTYDGEVTVFRAEQFHKPRPDDLGWRRMIPADRLTVIDVPGAHNTILRQPNVQVLAEKFATRLNSCDATRTDKTDSKSSQERAKPVSTTG